MKVKDIIEELGAYDGDAFFFLESTYQPYAGARPVTDIYRITEIYGRGAPHAILEYCGEKPDSEERRVNDEMEDSVREYFEFLFDKLDELFIEDISYSDYVQMNDWLGEIKNHVRRIGKKQDPMKPEKCQFEPLIKHGWDYQCPVCAKAVEDDLEVVVE